MVENSDRIRRFLRRWVRPIISTPLHPQWLVARQVKRKALWASNWATGDVLDIGCADRALQTSLVSAKSYIGLDYPMTADGLYGTLPDVYGNAASLPFAEAVFDTVILLDTLEHLSDPELALHEAFRVLRRNGYLLIRVPFSYPLHDQPHDYQRFTAYGLSYRLNQCGFSNVEIEEVGDGIETGAINLALALSQGIVEAMFAKNWHILFIPIAIVLVPLVNIFGLLFSGLLPAPRFMPSAYNVQAYKGN